MRRFESARTGPDGLLRALPALFATAALLGVIGCGGESAGQRPTTPTAVRADDPRAEAVGDFEGAQGAQRFQDVASTVCGAALEQAPVRPEPAASARVWRRYAEAARPAAQRLDQAIGTLAQQRPESDAALAPVRAEARRLLAVLQAVSAGQGGAADGVRASLDGLGNAAIAAELPACALR